MATRGVINCHVVDHVRMGVEEGIRSAIGQIGSLLDEMLKQGASPE